MDKILTKYKNLLIQKRYSTSTQNIYYQYFRDFSVHFNGKNLDNLTAEQINNYILKLVKINNISISQQNQRINAIKFYYEKTLGRDKQYYELHRPKKEYKLPKVLSKNEVKQILNFCNNIKHRCILTLIYSAGLRRSELLNLRLTDINSERMVINIEGAKGKKDRISLLSENIIKIINHKNIFLKEIKEGNTLLLA